MLRNALNETYLSFSPPHQLSYSPIQNQQRASARTWWYLVGPRDVTFAHRRAKFDRISRAELEWLTKHATPGVEAFTFFSWVRKCDKLHWLTTPTQNAAVSGMMHECIITFRGSSRSIRDRGCRQNRFKQNLLFVSNWILAKWILAEWIQAEWI
jgi:hypothetical protein